MSICLACKKRELNRKEVQSEENRRKQKKRKITVTSSLHEISTDQRGIKVEGEVKGLLPTPFL
jgi:hypothetical protein